jgi:hypothetical protein
MWRNHEASGFHGAMQRMRSLPMFPIIPIVPMVACCTIMYLVIRNTIAVNRLKPRVEALEQQMNPPE